MAKYRFFCVLSVLLMLITVATYAARDEAIIEGEWSLEDLDAAEWAAIKAQCTLQ